MAVATSPLVRSSNPVAIIPDGAANTTMSAEVRNHMGTTAVRVMRIVIEARYTLRGNPGVHKRTARSSDVAASEAKSIHLRPALLQDLEWRPSRWIAGSTSP
jgi:hypothetical protein